MALMRRILGCVPMVLSDDIVMEMVQFVRVVFAEVVKYAQVGSYEPLAIDHISVLMDTIVMDDVMTVHQVHFVGEMNDAKVVYVAGHSVHKSIIDDIFLWNEIA